VVTLPCPQVQNPHIRYYRAIAIFASGKDPPGIAELGTTAFVNRRGVSRFR
jgi:hypothetical protein